MWGEGGEGSVQIFLRGRLDWPVALGLSLGVCLFLCRFVMFYVVCADDFLFYDHTGLFISE